jgi:hypothetical protein
LHQFFWLLREEFSSPSQLHRNFGDRNEHLLCKFFLYWWASVISQHTFQQKDKHPLIRKVEATKGFLNIYLVREEIAAQVIQVVLFLSFFLGNSRSTLQCASGRFYLDEIQRLETGRRIVIVSLISPAQTPLLLDDLRTILQAGMLKNFLKVGKDKNFVVSSCRFPFYF